MLDNGRERFVGWVSIESIVDCQFRFGPCLAHRLGTLKIYRWLSTWVWDFLVSVPVMMLNQDSERFVS